MKVIILIKILAVFTAAWVNAQQVDERLWGTWKLETVEITANGFTKQYSLEDLLVDKSRLPRNLLLSLYFFNDQVGACTSETEFSYEMETNIKGSFTTNNGELTTTIYGEQPRTFTYTIEDDLLKIRYSQANTQFDVNYKLIAKNIR